MCVCVCVYIYIHICIDLDLYIYISTINDGGKELPHIAVAQHVHTNLLPPPSHRIPTPRRYRHSGSPPRYRPTPLRYRHNGSPPRYRRSTPLRYRGSVPYKRKKLGRLRRVKFEQSRCLCESSHRRLSRRGGAGGGGDMIINIEAHVI